MDTWREAVLSLPGVERFYSGPDPKSYEGTFDVISLSHVLEHVLDPIAFLKRISGQLAKRGRILVASPDLRPNPIDLVIADHCTHFEEHSLAYVAEKAGLAVDLLSASLLPKELMPFSRPAALPAHPRWRAMGRYAGEDSRERCLFYFNLLDEVRKAARGMVGEKRPFGIMGSSIAACWMMLELDGRVDFFVDEDPHRIGHELTGLPILGPEQVPAGALVFIPMSAPVTKKMIHRWRHLPLDFRFVASNRPYDRALQP